MTFEPLGITVELLRAPRKALGRGWLMHSPDRPSRTERVGRAYFPQSTGGLTRSCWYSLEWVTPPFSKTGTVWYYNR